MNYIKRINLFFVVSIMLLLFGFISENTVSATDIYDGEVLNVEIEEGNRQFRGVWVSALVSDVPRYQNKTQYQNAITQVLNNMEKNNFNTLVFHIRIYNDAFYKSEYCSYSSLYKTNPDWEALPWIIEECHKRGIEFHAWMNPYRVSTSVSQTKEQIASKFKSSNAASNPSNLLIGNEFVILNPGLEEVQKYLLNVCMEVVQNYDIDAIHFDDYFYAAGVDDSYTYKKYGSEYKSLTDFRRASITKFIKSLHEKITEYNVNNGAAIKLGISPTAIYRCGDGEVTYDENGHAITTGALMSSYFDQHYESACADTLKWIQEGYIDYIVPQLYANGTQFLNVSTWWNKVIKYEKCNFVAGITDNSCEWDHFNDLDNASGVCLFSYKSMSKLMSDSKAKEYFKDEALPLKSSYVSQELNYAPEIGVVSVDNGYEIAIRGVDNKINYAILYKGKNKDLFKDENKIGYISYNNSKSYLDVCSKDDSLFYGVVLVSNDGSFSYGTSVSVKDELYKIVYKTNSGEILKTEFLKQGEKLTYPLYEHEEGKKYIWSDTIDTANESKEIVLNIVIEKFEIKYVAPDGEVLYTQYYNYGESLNLPELISNEKYILKRWKVGGLYKVIKDDIIEASFDYIYYDVNFYYNGNVIKTASMYIGEELVYPNVKLDSGYELVGWDNESAVCTGAMNINAVVQQKVFTVYIKYNDEVLKTYEVNYNSSLSLNEVFEKEGFIFKGYKLNGSEITKVDKIKEDIIIEAVFEEIDNNEDNNQNEGNNNTETNKDKKKSGCGSGLIIIELSFAFGALFVFRKRFFR